MEICVVGLGRIGRHILRQLVSAGGLSISICDKNPDVENICYLLNYDSVYGLRSERFSMSGPGLIRDYQTDALITVISIEMALASDSVVIDCTGDSGLGSQWVTATCSRAYLTNSPPEAWVDDFIVPSVHSKADGKVVSTSICDVTAIAPILLNLWSNFGCARGTITTLHPWLNYQNLNDNSVRSSATPDQYWSEYSLGRKATENLISKPTSVGKALELAFPELFSGFNCWSYRVPTPVVASAILTVELEVDFIGIDDVAGCLENAEQIEFSKKNLISSDFIESNAACHVDLASLGVTGRMLYLGLWYDNEFGYASNVVQFILRNEGIVK